MVFFFGDALITFADDLLTRHLKKGKKSRFLKSGKTVKYVFQWRSQKFSTGGASIFSIPFCPFPFSCRTKSAVQSKKRHCTHRVQDSFGVYRGST